MYLVVVPIDSGKSRDDRHADKSDHAQSPGQPHHKYDHAHCSEKWICIRLILITFLCSNTCRMFNWLINVNILIWIFLKLQLRFNRNRSTEKIEGYRATKATNNFETCKRVIVYIYNDEYYDKQIELEAKNLRSPVNCQ